MLLLAIVAGPASAQIDAQSDAQAQGVGYPSDWSHRHLIFSNPGNFEAGARGDFAGWMRTMNDPRYALQLGKRNSAARVRPGDPRRHKPTAEPVLERDWSQSLGLAGSGVAPDMYPAKWQFVNGPGTADCTNDYVVLGVNKAGASGTQPNIVGLANLYVNAGGTGLCAGTAPTVKFSYFVGTGIVQTSPVLGLSAGQVAYVESIAGGSKLHVLKNAGVGAGNGTIAAPVAPGTGNTATDATVLMNGSATVTRSSPFYDYASDTAYVGDDSGKLHKFTPVFNGTPAEIVQSTGGNAWPAVLGGTLTGPVYDSASQRVFVGSSNGILYSVNKTTGSGTSGAIASAAVGSGAGIMEAPIVDGSAESVYVFVGANSGATASAVLAFQAGFTAGNAGSTSATVGTTSATLPLYAGAFNNTYYTSGNAAQPAGSLYVCGNAGGVPTLYRIPITTAGTVPTLGAAVAGPALGSGVGSGCSPLTEFFNTSTSTDWLFASVPSSSCGAGTGLGGCVMSFNLVTPPVIGPWTPSTTFANLAQVVDTAGRTQSCNGGGCASGATGSTSGTTTPAWTTPTTTDGTTTNATAVGTVSANSAVGGATVIVGTLTMTASAPTAEVDTIGVPTSVYCVPPNAGVTVQGVNVTTNGTAPTGGVVNNISNSNTTAGVTVTVAGVVYTWQTTLAAAGCGTTLNCILKGNDHQNNADALARAINASGPTCADTGFVNPCYVLATGQGANRAAIASHVANTSDTVTMTWKCAGTAALFPISTSDTLAFTITSPTGGGLGSAGTHLFAIPSPASNATLSSNINTALGTVTGASKSYTSPTITLTASAAGSTGITAALDGAVTGVTVAVTTAGSDGSNTAPNFQYWSGAAAVPTATLASNISAAAAGNSANVTLAYTSGSTFTATGTGTNAGGAGDSVAIAGTLTGFTWSPTGHLAGGNTALIWTSLGAGNGQTTFLQATGTSGIIIDNAGAGIETANIYFGTLNGTGQTNAAVKLTQAGLQ